MKNRTKAKLAAGETVFGAMVNLPSPAVVESLAFAQLDFAILNTEHAAIDIATSAEPIPTESGPEEAAPPRGPV